MKGLEDSCREMEASSEKELRRKSRVTGLLWCRKLFLIFHIVWVIIPIRAPRIRDNLLQLCLEMANQMAFGEEEKDLTCPRSQNQDRNRLWVWHWKRR